MLESLFLSLAENYLCKTMQKLKAFKEIGKNATVNFLILFTAREIIKFFIFGMGEFLSHVNFVK